MESTSKKSNLPLIRRCLAIGLVLLSIMFMFWPATVAVSSRLRNSRIDDRAALYMERYDCSESQARAIASFELSDNLRGVSASDLRSRLTYYALHQSVDDAYKKETRGEDWFDDYLDRLSDDIKIERTLNTLGGVCVNIFFFCMLAAGVAAIVLYALNKTRIAGIVFAVFAVLLVAVAIGYMIYTNVSTNEALDAKSVSDEVWDVQHDPIVPGVSMFLIPIFAIASCIVYQRTGRKKARTPKPAAAPVEPYAPIMRPAVPADLSFTDTPRVPRDPFAQAQSPVENPFEAQPRAARDPYAPRPVENPFEPVQHPVRRPAPVETPADDPFAETVRSAENPFEVQPRDPFGETMRSSGNSFEAQPRDPFAETVCSTGNPFEAQPHDSFDKTVRPAGNPFETVQRQAPRSATVEQPVGNPFADAPRPAPRPAQAEQPVGNPFTNAPAPKPRPKSAASQDWTCPQCRKVNPESARFCSGCGTQKPAVEHPPVCQNCGMELHVGSRFCPYCGEKLE